jgi:hypothetical protein
MRALPRGRDLPAYLDEIAFRFNNRDKPYLFRDALLKLIVPDTLRYVSPISAQ